MAKSAQKPSHGQRGEMRPYYKVESFVALERVSALITHCKTHMWDAADRALAPYNITLSQWIVLKNLIRGDDGMTPAQMCSEIGYDRGAMTRLIDRLEESGFIRRAPNPEDRRSVVLEPTPAGRALHPKTLKVMVDEMNTFLAGFTAKEVQLLESFLSRVLTNVKAHTSALRDQEP